MACLASPPRTPTAAAAARAVAGSPTRDHHGTRRGNIPGPVRVLGQPRHVADRVVQARPCGHGSDFGLTGPGAVAVGPACVRGDQQPAGGRTVVPAPRPPPAANRGDCEHGGVVIDAGTDPAGVRSDAMDPVRDRLARSLPVQEVVRPDQYRLTGRSPLTAGFLRGPQTRINVHDRRSRSCRRGNNLQNITASWSRTSWETLTAQQRAASREAAPCFCASPGRRATRSHASRGTRQPPPGPGALHT